MIRWLLALGLLLPLSPATAWGQAHTPEPHDLVINEIHYRPPDQAQEFVELLNRSASVFDLRDFHLSDDLLQPVPITGTAATIGPGEYAVLVRDGDAFSEAFPGVPFIEVPRWPILRDSGDASLLYFGEQVIDSVGYAPSWGGYEREASLERIDPAGPADRAYNFGSSSGSPTPGRQNSIYAPDREPPRPTFAAAERERLEVYFDKPLDGRSVTPESFRLQEGARPRSTGLVEAETGVLLQFDEPVDSPQLHITGVRDLTGNVLDEASHAIAYQAPPFVDDRPQGLAVNEIMFVPVADSFDDRPDQSEYFEIFNRSDQTVNLTGVFWTTRPDENGVADTTRLSPDRVGLPPGGFAVVHATPDGADLEAAFPELREQTSDPILLPQSGSRLGLLNAGERIQLHRPDGTVLDRVTYAPSWHHPGLRDTRGVALERIAPDLPSDRAQNWTSSVHPSGGTPGMENSVRLTAGEGERAEARLTVSPSPFSPNGDGHDDVTSIRYRLRSDAALVRIRIYDGMGRRVRTLSEARLGGQHEDTLLWDGRDDQGQSLRLGIYVVHLEAVDEQGGTVETLRRPVVLAHPFQ